MNWAHLLGMIGAQCLFTVGVFEFIEGRNVPSAVSFLCAGALTVQLSLR